MISIAPGDHGGLPVPAQSARHADSRRRRAAFADRHVRRDVPVRLQPRQSLADGADDLDRLRGRRRDRGDREHLALPASRACRRSRRRITGASEIGFTVISISISLIAVFIPILLMGGIVGRLFREFAVTLVGGGRRFAGHLADHDADDVRAACCKPHDRGETRRGINWQRAGLQRDARQLRDGPDVGAAASAARCLAVALATLALNMYLFIIIPEGIFPAAGHRPPDGRDCRPTRTPRFRR